MRNKYLYVAVVLAIVLAGFLSVPAVGSVTNPDGFEGYAVTSDWQPTAEVEGWLLNQATYGTWDPAPFGIDPAYGVSGNGLGVASLSDPASLAYWEIVSSKLLYPIQTLSVDFKLLTRDVSGDCRVLASFSTDTGDNCNAFFTFRMRGATPQVWIEAGGGYYTKVILPNDSSLSMSTWYHADMEQDWTTNKVRARFGPVGGAMNDWSAWVAMATSAQYNYIRLLLNGEVNLDNVTLTAQPWNSGVTGTVTSLANGSPIAGVEVSTTLTGVGAVSVLTNASGVYTLPLPPGTYTVTASKLGFTQGTDSATVTTGAFVTKNFALGSGGQIQGTITDAGSALPIVGAQVSLGGDYSVLSQANGSYTLQCGAGTYTVYAQSAGYKGATLSNVVVTAGQTTSGVNIALESLGATGPVNPDDFERYGVVTAWSPSAAVEGWTAVCGGGGHFKVGPDYGQSGNGIVNPGSMATNDVATWFWTENISLSSTQTQKFDFKIITPTVEAFGNWNRLLFYQSEVPAQVIWEITNGVAVAYMTSGPGYSNTEFLPGMESVQLGTWYHAEIEHDWAAQQVRARFGPVGGAMNAWSGWGEMASTAQYSNSQFVLNGIIAVDNVEMITTPQGLQGTVTESGTGLLLAGALVSTTLPSTEVRTALTDANGVYKLGLPAGTYTVTASKSGNVSAQDSATVNEGQITNLNFILGRGGIVTGVITEAGTGLPVASATVSDTVSGTTTLTGPDGAYSLHLTPGTATIQAGKEGYVTPDPITVTVNAEQTTSGVSFILQVMTGGGLVNPDDFERYAPTTSWTPSQATTGWTTSAVQNGTNAPQPFLIGSDYGQSGKGMASPGTDNVLNLGMWHINPSIAQYTLQTVSYDFKLVTPALDGADSTCRLMVSPTGDDQATQTPAFLEMLMTNGQPLVRIQCGVSCSTKVPVPGTLELNVWYHAELECDYTTHKVRARFGPVGGAMNGWSDLGDMWGQQQYDYVRSLFLGVDYVDNFALAIHLDTTSLSALKDAPEGGEVTVTDPKVVTVSSGAFSGDVFYVEEPDRTVGMKMVPNVGVPAVTAGQRITFTGTVHTDLNGERYVQVSAITSQTAGDELGALGMPGSARKSLQAVQNLSGLLVRAWGKVTFVDSTVAYIDDGAGLNDGSGHLGLKVVLNDPTITVPVISTDDYLGVTGVMSAGGLRPRANSDVTKYAP